MKKKGIFKGDEVMKREQLLLRTSIVLVLSGLVSVLIFPEFTAWACGVTGATLSVDFAPELPELWHLPVSVLQILTISD